MCMPQRRHRRSGEHRTDRVRKPIQIERGVDFARRVEAHQRESAVKLPERPPCFSSSRTSPITMPRSTALHMS